MNDGEFIRGYLGDLGGVLAGLDTAKIAKAVEWLREVRDGGKTIYACGNGGSAAIASQMVTDIVKAASYGRKKRIKMINLADLFGTVTAYANDVSYESVFVEPLRNFAEAGDVLIAISGSGNSANVLRAVEYANSIGCGTIGMTTREGGKLREICGLALEAPGKHMGRLEDSFFVMSHILCYILMEEKD